MHTQQLTFSSGTWSGPRDGAPALTDAQLVLAFGDPGELARAELQAPLRKRYPRATLVFCSSGGNIGDDGVTTEGAVATAVRFSTSTVRAVAASLPGAGDSEAVARELVAGLAGTGLRHVLVFSEGLGVNGSALARGLAGALPDGVTVSGGLAADGDRFVSTVVGLNGTPAPGRVVAVGLYGERLRVAVGSYGGWEAFGPERAITRSEGSVLYELDGRPALAVYRDLLGSLGYALPASGLMFPLKVRSDERAPGLVRTILGVDERAQSVTFAGDIPQGGSARLMRTSLDALIEASATAAARCQDPGAPGCGGGLALAVSCIGRRLLLQQRVGEEIRSLGRVLGGMPVTGFYSYGELAPAATDGPCELHNQTMTVTTLREV